MLPYIQSLPHICYALPPGGHSIGGPKLYAIPNLRGQKLTEVKEPDAAIDLARRVQRGEEKAEAELVQRYSRGLLGFLQRKTDDEELANDLHQDTLRIVLERLRGAGLNDPSNIAGFIHATAKNLVIAHFRKQARRKTEPDSDYIDNAAHESNGLSDIVVRDEMATMVRTLLQELRSERDRELLLRFYLHEEDKQSICHALELTEKHFNRVIFRARARFKEQLLKHEKRSQFSVVK